MAEQSQSQHVLALARELLDDIELSRISGEQLLLKASRLARWVGSDETRAWLKLELRGYNREDPLAVKYLAFTGRWIDREKGKAYFGPLAQQEALIETERLKLSLLRVPDTSGEWANVAIQHVVANMTTSSSLIMTLTGIRTRVLAHLHDFVSNVYYEKEFDSLAASVFERYKLSVDSLIAVHCQDVIEKIPSVMSRLSENDSESISQALSTCRRIVESFADSIYPPSDATLEIDGNTLKLDAGKHQNRINAYIQGRSQSQSRKKKLRQNLSNLFERVSTGVHADVTAEEAQSLFLNTYLFLGEVLHLPKPTTT